MAALLPSHRKTRSAVAGHKHRRGTALRCPAYREDKRSEEHTSELQSLRHLVCRLLLEKKMQEPADIRIEPQPVVNGAGRSRAADCVVMPGAPGFGDIAALGGFFFNDTATTEIYTLSLHDVLPI